jgi:hypothetical protein
VLPSGLVWTVPISDASIVLGHDGRRLDIDVQAVSVIDAAPGPEAATVTMRMTWSGEGRARRLGRGTAVPPTDAAAFLGRFFRARVHGTFSGAAAGFAFQSKRRLRTIFAEVGTEQTGALLAASARCNACAGQSFPR